MDTTIEQQVAMDEALVHSTQRLRIERSNFRLLSDIQSKESTLQVVYDVLRRCPFFKAFLVTADVPEIYMPEFWAIANVHHHAIHFKMDNKKHIVNLESFRDMLHICPRIPGQSFDELPFEEEILDFFSFRLSQAQILWGLYHKRNIDYAFLIWEDFVYQVKHKNHKKSNEMYYPRFTKVIIHHFMSKDPSIPRRNKYGAMLPIELTNEEIRNTKAYKEYYAFATGEATPKPKASARRKRSGFDSSITSPTAVATPRSTIAATPRLTAAAKGKQPAKAPKAKSLSALSENSFDDEGADDQGKDGDDDKGDEGDESDDGEEDDDEDKDGDERDDDDADQEVAKTDKQDDAEGGGDDDDESESDEEDDDEETRYEESFDPIPRTPRSSGDDRNDEEDQGLKTGEEERLIEEEEADELYRDVNINQGSEIQLPQDIEDSHVTLTLVNPDGQQESSSVSSQFVTSMLNPTNDAGVESIFATTSTSINSLHTPIPTMTPSIIATITSASQAPIPPMTFPSDILQHLPSFGSLFRFDDRLKALEANFSEFSQTNPFAEIVSVISSIVQQYMNQQMTEAVRVAVQLQTHLLRDASQRENDEFLRTVDENMKKIIKSSHSSRTSYAVAADLSEMELKKILIEKMEGNKSIQRSDEQRNLYKALVEAYEADNIILDTYGERVILKRRRDDDDDKGEGPSDGSDRGSKRRREDKESESASAPLEPATRSAGRSTTGSKSRQASASESAFAEEPVQTTSQIEEPSHPMFETGAEDQPIIQSSRHPEWFSQLQKNPTPDRNWNNTLPAVQGSTQTWISELAKQADSRSSFNELLDTLLDFSNFIMNQLKVDTLTPEFLAGPTYELMKGSCKILIELEYLLEEVYKATTNQLDWVNPEGQQYPHNLLQPLSLIPDNRGRRVIPFVHFINNDLEYLWGGASSRKYTTSVIKTKAADYGHIKWIGDLVPSTMWIQEPIDYDKHALWGVPHWGRKRQQFYGFAVNRESARDVYSKRRITAIMDLKIVKWHSYKHLDWITVRRDDDKLYKFKEGNFKRLRLQDIEDMLLLLVQEKLSNLTIHALLLTSLLECLQEVSSSSDEAYTAYSNPQGFIYQNKDKKNKLMRIDELHKFSDGTLNDVRTSLDDRLKGIRMRYLPQTIWRKSDKDRATSMIQAIDKMLKTRRIMRSLEKFVGGRLHDRDFWMLQRTI
nr:hypothetical protein [Tanacetum cinerariifolium]